MFHPLQIIVFISMLNIQYPANAIYISSKLSKIINLDLLDPDVLGKILFHYSINDAISKDPNYLIDDASKTNILIT